MGSNKGKNVASRNEEGCDDESQHGQQGDPEPPPPPPPQRCGARTSRRQNPHMGQMETGQSSRNPLGTASAAGKKRRQVDSARPPPQPSKKPKSGHAGQDGQTNVPSWAQGVMQRPLPISRPQAYPVHPAGAHPPRNSVQRSQRIQALRNQVRFPQGQSEETLVQLLTWANWDVNRAATLFWESEALERRHLPTGRNMPAWNRPAVNVEQTRLNLLHDMQQGMSSRQRENYRTTNATIAMALQHNSWDLDEAARDIAARGRRGQGSGTGLFDDITDRLASMRTPPEGVPAQDRRLAEFVTITSTNSVDAARRVLMRHGWDLALAIDEWVLRGGITVRDSDRVRREWNPNRPRTVINGRFEYHDDEAPLPRHLNPSVEGGQSEGLAMDTPRSRHDAEAIATRDYDVQENGHGRRGYVVDENQLPAGRGAPDESRLRIEYVRRGEYHVDLFGRHDDRRNRRNYNFTEVAEPQRREFDWDDEKHISDLNKWRAERLRNITGETVRDETIPFNKYELAWLVEQEGMRIEERFFEAAGQNRFDTNKTSPAAWDTAVRKFGDGDTFPLPLSLAEKEALTDRFNESFAGRTIYTKWLAVRRHLDGSAVWERVYKDMGKVGVVPRPERTVAMIDQQRRRIRAHCKHFGLQFERGGDPGQSESDSDF